MFSQLWSMVSSSMLPVLWISRIVSVQLMHKERWSPLGKCDAWLTMFCICFRLFALRFRFLSDSNTYFCMWIFSLATPICLICILSLPYQNKLNVYSAKENAWSLLTFDNDKSYDGLWSIIWSYEAYLLLQLIDSLHMTNQRGKTE